LRSFAASSKFSDGTGLRTGSCGNEPPGARPDGSFYWSDRLKVFANADAMETMAAEERRRKA
jgi:hypothetical protein